jgi:hypothetical protein
VVTNQILHADGSDVATSEQYMVYVADTGTKPYVLRVYHQRDTLRRTPEGWKLAHRHAVPS